MDGAKELARKEAVEKWEVAKALSVECKCSHQVEVEAGSPTTEVSTLSLFWMSEVDWNCQLSEDMEGTGVGTTVGPLKRKLGDYQPGISPELIMDRNQRMVNWS